MSISDNSRSEMKPLVIRVMIKSDATTRSIIYDRHSDDSWGVIYAPRVVNYAPRKHL
jgi:hypothetical protein